MKNNTLLQAAHNGNYAAVKRFLVDGKAQRQFEDGDAWKSALLISSQKGLCGIVRLLLKHRLNGKLYFDDGKTSLIHACEKGCKYIANALIKDSKAILDHSDVNGRTPLIHACHKGHESIVRLLLKVGAYVHQQDIEGKHALMYACTNGHENIVKLLIKHKININAHDNDTKTALMYACIKGHLSIVEVLLRNDAFVNASERGRRTALCYACQQGHLEIVELLLQYDASIEPYDTTRNTALDYACFRNSVKIADILIKLGVEREVHKDYFSKPLAYCCSAECRVEIVTLFFKHQAPLYFPGFNNADTPLIIACKYGQLEVVESILAQETFMVKINNNGEHLKTALICVCESGRSDIIEMILKKKHTFIDVNIVDVYGKSALMYACEKGYDAVVSLLMHFLSSTIDFNASDKVKKTALIYVCQNGHERIVKMLTSQKIDIHMRDMYNMSSLDHACEQGHLNIVKHLLTLGFDTCVERHKAMLLACLRGHESVVDLLIEHDVGVSRLRYLGDSALHLACRSGNVKIVKMLMIAECCHIEHSGNVSPLMIACSMGSQDTVKFLMDYNVDINVCDGNGKTALMCACEKGCEAIVETLIGGNVDLNAIDLRGWAAFSYAFETGQDRIVDLLLAQKDVKVSGFGGLLDTPLIYACKQGNEQILKQLISRGVDLNECGILKKSALMHACEAGNEHIVRLLLQHNINLNALDANGKNALMYSWESGFDSIMRLLLRPDLDLEACFMRGKTTILMHACKRGDEDMVRSLINVSQNIHISARDRIGRTALMHAVEGGFDGIVDIIVTIQPRDIVSVCDCMGRTPLSMACLLGEKNVFDVLIKHTSIDLLNACDMNSMTALNYALEGHYDDIALALINEGIDVNCHGVNSKTPLMLACLRGHKDLIQQLLIQNANVNLHDRVGKTALMFASCGKSMAAEKIVQVLIENGSDVHAQDANGKSCLMYLCERGFKNAVHMLIEAGVNVNGRDKDRRTALMYAFQHTLDNSYIVHQLIKFGADVNAHDLTRKTILMYAIERKKQQHSLILLLTNGVNVNFQTRNKNTAMMQACALGYRNVVSLLKQGGANIHACNVFGRTPLMFACDKGHLGIVELLLKYRVSVQASDNRDQTALMLACKNGYDHIVKCLMKYRGTFDIDMMDLYGNTALMYACKYGHHSVMLTLIENKPCVQLMNDDASTPLVQACVNNDEVAVDLLMQCSLCVSELDYVQEYLAYPFVISAGLGRHKIVENFLSLEGFDPDVYSCFEERTALEAACTRGHTEVVRILLQSGADVDTKNENGRTPLIEASRKGHEDIVTMLLKHKADIDVCDTQRATALIHACKRSNYKIVKLLLIHGADSEIKDMHGRDAFWYCSCDWSADIVNYMMKKKNAFYDFDQKFVFVKHCNNWVELPRGRSKRNGHLQSLKCAYLLIHHGINIDTQNHQGQTAITWIASQSCLYSGNRFVANRGHYYESWLVDDLQKFLDCGASVDVVDGLGQTAFSYALGGNGLGLVVLLESKKPVVDKEERLRAVHRNAVRKGIKDGTLQITTSSLRILLEKGLFEWELCPENRLKYVSVQALRMGYCPGSIQLPDGLVVSPLISAILDRDMNSVHLFLDNLYFLPEDLHALHTNRLLRAKMIYPEQLEIVQRRFSLEELTFLSISKSISESGVPFKRNERVEGLLLPWSLKDRLRFAQCRHLNVQKYVVGD